MTLKLYFNNAAPDVTPPAWRFSAYEKTSEAVQRQLGLAKAGANTSVVVSETSTSNVYDMPHGAWTSPPFQRDASIAGTETIGVTVGRIANAASSFVSLLHVYVMAPDGSVRGTLMNSRVGSSSWGNTSQQNGGWSHAAVAALDVLAGDRLVIEMGVRATNTTATSRTATIWYGNGGGADFDVDTPGQSGVTTRVGNVELVGAGLESLWIAPPTTAPGDVLDIGPAPRTNHWAVQVAKPAAGAIETHDQDEIFADYTDYPWYYGLADGSRARMRAPVNGPTTSGASSARCEHRELNVDGSNAAWDPFDGLTHTLHVRVKAIHLPPVLPDVVFAQLHNGTTDRVAIRSQLVSGTTRLRARVNGSSVTPELANWGAAGLGSDFEIKLVVVNGQLSIYYNDMGTPLITSSALVSTGGPTWYFKTGCYLQTDPGTDAATEYGEVEIWDLAHSHVAPAGPEPGRRLLLATA